MLYDTNYNIIPILFAHFNGAECHNYWQTVFDKCFEIYNFGSNRRTIIIDQEKSIDTAFDKVRNAKPFLDAIRVRKSIGSKLWSSKASGLALYKKKVIYPSSQHQVKNIIDKYIE